MHITAINTVNLAVRGNTMRGAGLKVPKVHDFDGTWGNSIYIYNSTGHLVEGNNVSGNWWSALVSGQNATNGMIPILLGQRRKSASSWADAHHQCSKRRAGRGAPFVRGHFYYPE